MSAATRDIPHREKYKHHINSAACSLVLRFLTQEGSDEIRAVPITCGTWSPCPGKCSQRNREQWLPILMEEFGEGRLSGVLGALSEQDCQLEALKQSLSRHGLGGRWIRENGALWFFMVGEVEQDWLDRAAERYGFINMGMPTDDDALRGWLTKALSEEKVDLGGRRKLKAWGTFIKTSGRRDREQHTAIDAAAIATDTAPSEALEEISENLDALVGGGLGSRASKPSLSAIGNRLGRWIKVDLLIGEGHRWLDARRRDARYTVDDCWWSDEVRVRWVGQGQKPSWGLPGVRIRGL